MAFPNIEPTSPRIHVLDMTARSTPLFSFARCTAPLFSVQSIVPVPDHEFNVCLQMEPSRRYVHARRCIYRSSLL